MRKIILASSSMGYGGADLLALSLGRELRDREWDVRVVSLVAPELPESRWEGLEVRSLELAQAGDIPKAVVSFRRLTRDASIVHSHMFHANILARVASVASARVINTLHSVNEGPAGRDHVYRLTNRFADAIVAVGTRVAETRGPLAFPGCDIQIVRNAVEAPSRIQPQPATHRFVTIGRLVRAKGYDNLIRAVRVLVDSGVPAHFTVVGDGPLRNDLVLLAKSLNLDAHIDFVGQVDNVSTLLQRARYYVQPSRWEGLPVSLLEALAHARPAVVTDVGDMGQLIREAGAGWVCPTESSVESLAYALGEACRSDARVVLGKGLLGRNHVVANYGIAAWVDEWERIYDAE